MKNLFKTIVLVALAVSCAKEIGNESAPDAATRRYNLSFAESTKTELSGSGSTRQVKWNTGDAIRYYTEPGQSSPASATVALNGDKAYIDIEPGRADVVINAVYGASQLNSASSTENTMYVNSPVKNSQNYTSFSQAHICAAFSDDIENPNLTFHNVAAILKFTSASAIHKVVFHGNNNEVITAGSNGSLKITHSAGNLTVEPAQNSGTSVTVQTNGTESDFYIAVLPVQFEKGITVDCYDSNLELIATKKTTNAVNTVSSSGAPKVLNLGNIQDWLNNSLPVAVDLGLSVKWARTNLGAAVPEEYGDYFAWGETEPKTDYSWSTYKFELGADHNGPFSKYVTNSNYGTVDNKTVLDPEDDAAHVNWGGSWRMPTREECEELINKCTWTWTTQNGVKGRLVTGPNGKSIFLPAAGYRGNTYLYGAGSRGYYWSSSLYTGYPNFAWSVYFDSDYVYGDGRNRFIGQSVRPVYGEIVPVSSISIPETTTLPVGKSEILTATVLPADATYKTVTWSSSDESVATVDAAGKVTAVSIGNATITAYSADASKAASCEVTVVETAKPEAVDLGLPSGLKWATFNVGASAPEEYGDYFAWGETEPKTYYSWSTYKFRVSGDGKWDGEKYNLKFNKYCTKSSYWDSSDPMDNKTLLDPEDDAAHVNWGGSWRMPTKEEQDELRTECTWIWTTENGVNGRKVTGPNGKSIFLPAAGRRGDTSLYDAGSWGYFWSSSLYTVYPDSAYYVDFYSDDVYFGDYFRCYGFSVRPVSE